MEDGSAGRVAFVTGAGSATGIGFATARILGREGASVAIASTTERIHERADELGDAGVRAVGVVADLTRREQVRAAVQEVRARLGRIDVLVNNAGADVTAPFDELTPTDWDRVLGVNLHGPIRLSRLVFPHMRRGGGGHIVNVTSTAAKRAWANASAYHASKWGLLGFSHALHVEGRPLGIKVTAVVAGGMRTPFLLDRFPDIDQATLQDPRNVAETVRFVLTRPPGTVIPEIMVIPMRETSWP